MKGLHRLWEEQGLPRQQRKPMTIEVLETLRRSWSEMPGSGDARILWAATTPNSNKGENQEAQNGPAQARLHAGGWQYRKLTVPGEGSTWL